MLGGGTSLFGGSTATFSGGTTTIGGDARLGQRRNKIWRRRKKRQLAAVKQRLAAMKKHWSAVQQNLLSVQQQLSAVKEYLEAAQQNLAAVTQRSAAMKQHLAAALQHSAVDFGTVQPATAQQSDLPHRFLHKGKTFHDFANVPSLPKSLEITWTASSKVSTISVHEQSTIGLSSVPNSSTFMPSLSRHTPGGPSVVSVSHSSTLFTYVRRSLQYPTIGFFKADAYPISIAVPMSIEGPRNGEMSATTPSAMSIKLRSAK
eukprot:CAMPEP_0196653572 /NCGR_PEP_ID=MMETSP1086-20130531/3216_1 /TAXON_ID=77921 /ORGANISM="Cyanoptyche  gloeocystis , Strain SAG4.97" /LENGTH=259 /DNA_ID=CAMNT_0041984847 /DNA_START=186 /DNA_END=965 /DNA_ORIENTATION=-